MGIMVYAVLWVMQDLHHQQYDDGSLRDYVAVLVQCFGRWGSGC